MWPCVNVPAEWPDITDFSGARFVVAWTRSGPTGKESAARGKIGSDPVAFPRPGVPLRALSFLIATFLFTAAAVAAPYAAMVVDARSGEVLHSRNADTQLHPASLTKMMTLYVVFEAVKNGEIGLDDKVTISRSAASEPPSKIGLRAGQKIALRYLIRAAAVKSANDAATALGEAIEGSESAFAARMNRTAKALGMSRTTFRNAHGLTQSGHLSTARDMTTLGRHLFYDHPEYYNLFSRRSADTQIRTVHNTNRRFLGSYAGADGIKTGYTRAAGFNLVASAHRGQERIIATVFGGHSSADRNRKVQDLLDIGFSRAPTQVAIRKPPLPNYGAAAAPVVLASSLRPLVRPRGAVDPVLVAAAAPDPDAVTQALHDAALAEAIAPRARPAARDAVEEAVAEAATEGRVVARMSSSGGRHWGINVGRYASRYQAEQILLKTALTEIGTLDEALRKVVRSPRGWEANFVGLTEDRAQLACRRLAARDVDCSTLGPG